MKRLQTIRGKILLVFSLCFVIMGLNAVFYYWHISSLAKRLGVLDDFGKLRNDILEIRRFEKNYFLYRDTDDYKYLNSHLISVDKILNRLAPEIRRIAGVTKCSQFEENLANYNSLIDSIAPSLGGQMTWAKEEAIRAGGTRVLELAQEIVAQKRTVIDRALNRAMQIPFAFGGIFLLLLFAANAITRAALSPLRLIRQTTEKIATGDFSPIDYSGKRQDEIFSVMNAFNRMVRELELRQEELVQSRKIAAIGTLTAGIAHELNNPINNISITAEMLIEDFHDLSNEGKVEMLNDILSQSEKASEVVKNLLDFSRSESHDMGPLSIKTVINETVRLVKNQISLSHIGLHLDVPDDLPLVQGNKRNIEQVFINLLLNAIHAMQDGGKISIRAQVLLDGYLKIDVSDSGKGIPQDVLSHIFDPFFTTMDVGKGTGLGLSVSYGIVKKHSGRIEVESEVGKGSTFSVYLPIVGVEEMDPDDLVGSEP